MPQREYHFRLPTGENNNTYEISVRADRIELPVADPEGGKSEFRLYRADELVGAVDSHWVVAWWMTELEDSS